MVEARLTYNVAIKLASVPSGLIGKYRNACNNREKQLAIIKTDRLNINKMGIVPCRFVPKKKKTDRLQSTHINASTEKE
jgi:hypothetical protein